MRELHYLQTMVSSRLKSCFISAPFGTDTASLRDALNRRNVRWADATTIPAAGNLTEAITGAIGKSDFFCLVAPDERRSNVFFELGIAVGKGKPVLAFVQSSEAMPFDAATYFRLSLSNTSEVERAIDTFLQHSKPVSKKQRPAGSTKTASGLATRNSATLSGLAAEERTAELFRQAGFIVSTQPVHHDRGADLAVWIDELGPSLAGPLIVQVKSGGMSADNFHRAESQLREYVAKAHSLCGLLVYWNADAPPLPKDSQRGVLPLVVSMSGERLGTLLENGEFARELTQLRNAAVHGRV